MFTLWPPLVLVSIFSFESLRFQGGSICLSLLMTAVYRTMPAAVKIIGISSGAGLSPPVKFCQLWYDGDSVPQTTVAVYVIVPETHDRKSVLSSDVIFVLC